jgi:Adenylate and Guanylate cyclase catalytic domain
MFINLPKFEDTAAQVLDVLHLNMAKSKEFLESWSLQISLAEQQAARDNEPFVTLPNFELLGQDMLAKSGARLASFCPVVTKENRPKWEEYAVGHQEWIKESLRVAGSSLVPPFDVLEFIHRPLGSHQNATEPLYGELYLPVWQTVPIVGNQDTINFDLFNYSTFVPKAYDTMVASAESVMYQSNTLDDMDGIEVPPDMFIATPVFKSSNGTEGSASMIIGVIMSLVPWDSVLRTSLVPGDTPAMTLVVENSCFESFSFDIQGNATTYLGHGDRHDDSLNYDEVGIMSTVFQSVPGCETHFRMYPSQAFRDESSSNLPWIYACSVVGLFLLTASTFYAHEISLQRRQKKYIKAANHSNAIVRSLFPDTVRSRMIGEQDRSRAPEVESDPHSNSEATDEEASASMTQSSGSRPIADFFPHASVCFLDIAGFTAWSSSREPTQVFMLLESIYSSFDKIASRHKVFKVETVGDSYVAATGLPDRMNDHAGKCCLNNIHCAAPAMSNRSKTTILFQIL